jgi:hypothetical protein
LISGAALQIRANCARQVCRGTPVAQRHSVAHLRSSNLVATSSSRAGKGGEGHSRNEATRIV